MSISNDTCAVCHQKVKGVKNIAVFDCGHKHHLSCVLTRATYFNTKCVHCSEVQNLKLKPDLGDDRDTAMLAAIEAKIKRHQMEPKPEPGFLYSILTALSPFVSEPSRFKEYLYAGYNLPELKKMGFTPSDSIQDNMSWNNIRKYVDTQQLLQFGFTWQDMVALGIRAEHLKDFTWSQIKHTLGLNAKDILKLNVTLEEISELKYTPHQLNDLGFTWEIFSAMGANVSTLKMFDISIEDIKTYFSPTMNQWLDSGFYNRDMLVRNGWDVDKVIQTLPQVDCRADGRTLRLAF